MKNFKVIFLIFSLMAGQNAFALECGKIEQGAIVLLDAKGFESAKIGSREYKVAPDGGLIVAFDREDPKEMKLQLVGENGKVKTRNLNVAAVKWDIQDIKGVPQKTVTPSKIDEKGIVEERTQIRGALAIDEADEFWKNGFTRPIEGRISGKFGGQRIMNGMKKDPHAGVDLAAMQGTPVKSAGDGIVTLAAPDLFYSGNVVIVDHGYNLQTIYAHLQKMDVKKGDVVKKGQVIGAVGMTGRATGPHLHWGASLRGVRFDPLSLLKLNNSDNQICAID